VAHGRCFRVGSFIGAGLSPQRIANLVQRHRQFAFLLLGSAVAAGLCARPSGAAEPAPWAAGAQGAESVPSAPRVSGTGRYGIVPGPPAPPIEAVRPQSWPGNPTAPPQRDSAACPPAATAAALEACQRAQMVGRVGCEAILVSDVIDALETMLISRREELEKKGGKVPPEQWEAQRNSLLDEMLHAIDEAIAGNSDRSSPLDSPEERAARVERKSLLGQLLKQQIETKLVYQDAKKTLPAENFSNVEKQLKKQFDEVEIPKLLKQAGVDSYRELDQHVRNRGSSLERERQKFMQRVLVQQWLWQKLKVDDEITYDQMKTYYRDHPTEFDVPARTRWQELMVPVSKIPSKREAQAVLENMGNQVLSGADFAQVAKAGLGGKGGSDGSIYDWPDKSRMASPIVAQAIEGLPVGQLSPILEDWRGFHILRVVERRPAGRTPFEAAQAEIRDKVRRQRSEEQMQAYLARLKEQTPVWTILDAHPDSPQLSRRPDYPLR
jgi:parvulin-like peptidyl-prolyl isomerase